MSPQPIDNVIDQPRVAQYVATAAQDTFDYPFAVLTAGGVSVIVDGTQLDPADYTVTGVGADNGGQVVLNTPLDGGEIVTVFGSARIERLTNYQFRGPFDSERFNVELDRMTIVQQELREATRRAMSVDVEDPNRDLVIPQDRANRVLVFDDDGNPTTERPIDFFMTDSIRDLGEITTLDDADEFIVYQDSTGVERRVSRASLSVDLGVSRVFDAVSLGASCDGVTDDTASIQGILDNFFDDGVTLKIGPAVRVSTVSEIRAGFSNRSTFYIEGVKNAVIDASNCAFSEVSLTNSSQGLFTLKDCENITILVGSFEGVNANFPNEDLYSGFVVATESGCKNIRAFIGEAKNCHGFFLAHDESGTDGVVVRAGYGDFVNYGVTLRKDCKNVEASFAVGRTRRALFVHGAASNIRANFSVSDAKVTALRLGVGSGGSGPIENVDITCNLSTPLDAVGAGNTQNIIQFRGDDNVLRNSTLTLNGAGFCGQVDIAAAEGSSFSGLVLKGFLSGFSGASVNPHIRIGSTSVPTSNGLFYSLSAETSSTDATYLADIRNVNYSSFRDYTLTAGVDGETGSGQPMLVSNLEYARWSGIARHVNRRTDGSARSIILQNVEDASGDLHSTTQKGTTGTIVRDELFLIPHRPRELYGQQLSYDPPSIAAGESVTTSVTVTGAAVGDFAVASLSRDPAGIVLSAHVTSANTVTVTLFNASSGAVDLASSTVRVRVFKRP